MLLFAFADGLATLVAARVIQGLSTGAAISAVGAGMLDVDKVRGAVANSVAPATGTALGAVLAGLMVHYLPAPTHIVYFILAAIFVAQVIGVVLMPESMPPRAGAMASLRPQFSLPSATRQPILVAAPVLLTQRLEGRSLMTYGATALIAGVAVTVASLSYHCAPAFFLGTALAGNGFGTGFQAAIRTVVPLAAPGERAGVLSVIFLISYLAMGLPAVVAGYLVARSGDLFLTAREFGAVVMVLAALALIGTLRRTSSQRN